MARPPRDQTESGVMVYPRMPVPKPGEGEPKRPSQRPAPRKAPLNKSVLAVVIGALVGGIALGAVLRPIVLPDARIGQAEEAAAAAGAAAAAAKARAGEIEKELEAASTKRREVEKRLEVAARAESKLADAAAEEEKRGKELAAAQKKLAGALRGAATVVADGADLRITINSAALFARDDVLSDGGKRIVDRVGASLKDMLDKQIAVHGHTDDTPLPLPKPLAPAPKKGARPAGPAAPTPPRFPTNWELSAGRAVAVARRLQEASKLDPARLSAEGFGQYRPISPRNKAANRRIEIVLSPKATPKPAPKPAPKR